METDYGDFIEYFGDRFGKWDWCKVSTEARKALSDITECEIHQDSEIANLIDGACAQAAHGAFHAIAACLGVSKYDVMDVVEQWYENQENLPDSISFAEFEHRVINIDGEGDGES